MSSSTLAHLETQLDGEAAAEPSGRRTRRAARRAFHLIGRLFLWGLALVGSATLVLGGVVVRLSGDDVVWDRVVPEFWASITELRATQDRPGDGIVEGRDYAFQQTNEGRLFHWSCGKPIPVILIGNPPAGVENLVFDVTALLSEKSGLPLVARHQPRGGRDVSGAITVLYGDLTGDAAVDFDDELAHARTAAKFNGAIAWSAITVLTGPGKAEYTLPAKNLTMARSVLLHELAHAVGLNHSASGAPGVMNSGVDANNMVLSHGDEFALRVVGCPR